MKVVGLLVVAAIVTGTELVAPQDLSQATVSGDVASVRTQWDAATGIYQVTVAAAHEHPWDVECHLPVRDGLRPGDVVGLSLQARVCGATEGSLSLGVQRNRPPWDKPLWAVTALGPAWQEVRGLGRVDAALTARDAVVVVYLGARAQCLELRDLHVAACAPAEVPAGWRHYPGDRADAPWRADADARIRQHRMGPCVISARTPTGAPWAGAHLRLRQLRQAFPFGTAIEEARLTEAPYVEALRQRFNAVVLENALKPPEWEHPGRRALALGALQQMAREGMMLRGHCAAWGAEMYQAPTIQSLLGYRRDRHGDGRDAARLVREVTAERRDRVAAAIADHVAEVVGATAGRCLAWDVLNEPILEPALPQALGMPAVATWYRMAQLADPHTVLYTNDNGLVGDPDRCLAMERFLRDARAAGAPIQGLGEQGHFTGLPPGIPALEAFVNRFAAQGCRLSLTEFDADLPDEELAAHWLRDCFTYLYSRPEVDALFQWGFWEGQHWRPRAALLRRDWSERPIGRAYRELVREQWWTDQEVVTDAQGHWEGRLFLGTIAVEVDGQRYVMEVVPAGAHLVVGGARLPTSSPP